MSLRPQPCTVVEEDPAVDLGRRGVRFGFGLTRTEAQAAAHELNARLSL
jgi:hypothetical protein